VWLTYHPVKPGLPVTLRASNVGTAPIRFQIGVDVPVS
jgi:hypothetical protein